MDRTDFGLRALPATARLSDRAYGLLRDQIINGELRPGQRLDIYALAASLQLSVTPVKEALSRLRHERLVEQHPRQGTFVADPDPAQVGQAYDVRRALELYALDVAIRTANDEDIAALEAPVREAAELLRVEDPRAAYSRFVVLGLAFHRAIVKVAGNPRLSELHEQEYSFAYLGRAYYHRADSSVTAGGLRDLAVGQAEHEAILAAIKARDTARARDLLEDHLDRGKPFLVAP